MPAEKAAISADEAAAITASAEREIQRGQKGDESSLLDASVLSLDDEPIPGRLTLKRESEALAAVMEHGGLCVEGHQAPAQELFDQKPRRLKEITASDFSKTLD